MGVSLAPVTPRKDRKMAQNKTQATVVDPIDFIDTVEHPTRKADAHVLLVLFKRATRFEPKM
ncbi:conserved hypothetical protein [Rhodobacteraceae bacterium HTCC2083]|jgi:hypothetical protein|nr:conserved hypothetical protein [Rhodobacteraceae bacterium HTCC2083]